MSAFRLGHLATLATRGERLPLLSTLPLGWQAAPPASPPPLSAAAAKTSAAPPSLSPLLHVGSGACPPISWVEEIAGPAALKNLGGLRIGDSPIVRGFRVGGFSGLDTVGAISITSGDQFQLRGFDNLTTSGPIRLSANFGTIAGFPKLVVARGNLSILMNRPGLSTSNSFSAFAGLTEVQGYVELVLDKPDYNLFPQLKTVAAMMIFKDSSQFQASGAFPKLETVGGDLTVENNSQGFRLLTRVEGTLKITRMPDTSTSSKPLKGFTKLTHVSGNIHLDKLVSRPDAQKLADRLIDYAGTIFFE